MSQRSEYHPQPDPPVASYAGSERRSQTALSQLARQFDYACTSAVDSLQIAAALESGGITDRIAHDEYGLPDVFALAEELYRRVPRRLKTQAGERRSSRRWQTLRELSHGPLFALPGLAYPAVAAAIGGQSLLVGLVFSTAVGWAWGLGVSWLGYRLIGRGFHEEAARLLLRLSLIGVLAAELGALLLSYLLGLPTHTVLLATGQMAYQMAASVLIMYRLEAWLLLSLLPSIAANGWYLILGSPAWGQSIALWGSTATLIILQLGAFIALWKTPRAKSFFATLSAGDFVGVLPVLGYGSLSATLVLLGNARYMFSSLDLSLSILPLVLSMGVLEWQIRRFRERSTLFLRETRWISEFVPKVWRALLQSLGVCLLAVSLISCVTVFGLYQLGMLSQEGTTMFAAHLLLAGAFFINFILLAQSRFGWMLGSFAGAVLLYLGAGFFLSPALSYLAATSLLMVAVTIAIGPNLGRVAHYR